MKDIMNKFVLFLILLSSLTLHAYADEVEDYWENIPKELHERYDLANRSIEEDWVLQFADSLDIKARELNNLRLKMFASQIRSHYAFAKNDSSSYIYHNNRTMSLAKEANVMSFYYTEKMGRVLFFSKNRHSHHAIMTIQELLHEAKENKDNYGVYFSYMAMCHIYTTRKSYRQSIEYGLKAVEYLDMMDNPSRKSRAYIYNQLAANYLNIHDYENCIKNIKTALKYNDKLSEMYYTLCKAYFEMGETHDFRDAAEKYMTLKSNTEFSFGSDVNVVKALVSMVDKDFDQAQAYIDSIATKDAQMYCQLNLYKSQRDWQKAFMYQELIFQYEDSISQILYSEEISDMSGELDSLYKSKAQEEVKMRQRFYMITSFVIMIAIIVTSIIFIMRYRAIKSKNRALASNIDKLIKYKQKVLELENEKYGKRPIPSLNDELEDYSEYIVDENDNDEDDKAALSDMSVGEDLTCIERFIYELTSRKLFTDVNFNRDTLIDELHIQKRTFTKKFEAYTGCSFKEYITALRLEYAAQLIKEHPEYTIEAIAMECGIASYVTFHRNFTRHFGIAPSSYRAQ